MNNFESYLFIIYILYKVPIQFSQLDFTADRFYNNRNFVLQIINKLSTVVDEKHFETAKLKENRSKNRYSNILPGEF